MRIVLLYTMIQYLRDFSTQRKGLNHAKQQIKRKIKEAVFNSDKYINNCWDYISFINNIHS